MVLCKVVMHEALALIFGLRVYSRGMESNNNGNSENTQILDKVVKTSEHTNHP
jgi:hypothetical protein